MMPDGLCQIVSLHGDLDLCTERLHRTFTWCPSGPPYGGDMKSMVRPAGVAATIGRLGMDVRLLAIALVTGCALHAHVDEPGPNVASFRDACAGPPAVQTGHFRHVHSRVAAMLGAPDHRGVDLIASEADEVQTLGGKLAYTAFDKALEDEDADVFACVDDTWRSLRAIRTDDDGRFEITLAGADRLPVGMRDLYVRVIGDGTGVRFLAYVAPVGTSVLVTDVDGTITSSESAMMKTVLFGDDIGHQAGAPEAFAASGYPIVYVTARGDQYTEVTRQWLRIHGFPRGPLRLAPSQIMLHGASTVAFKVTALRGLRLPIAAAVGNRATDIEAYADAGLSPAQILVHEPEFVDEMRDSIAAGKATTFEDYRRLDPLLPDPM